MQRFFNLTLGVAGFLQADFARNAMLGLWKDCDSHSRNHLFSSATHKIFNSSNAKFAIACARRSWDFRLKLKVKLLQLIELLRFLLHNCAAYYTRRRMIADNKKAISH